jgi:hypothetical protein
MAVVATVCAFVNVLTDNAVAKVTIVTSASKVTFRVLAGRVRMAIVAWRSVGALVDVLAR